MSGVLINPREHVVTLTNSVRSTFDSCRFKTYLSYLHNGCGIVPFSTKPPLRFGNAVHVALGQYYAGAEMEMAIGEGLKHYRDLASDPNVVILPDDAVAIEKERAKLEGMLLAYGTKYDPVTNDTFEVVGSELVVTHTLGVIIVQELPGIYQPWRIDLAGRLDILGKDRDDLFVMDHKTMGSFRESFYNKCLFDFQTTAYCILASAYLERPVRKVIYNCIRKSALRGTSSESTAQLVVRIKQDYLERLDSYFNRITAIRTDQQVNECINALIQVGAEIIYASLHQMWRKNMAMCDVYSGCQFQEICAAGVINNVNFRDKTTAHEELEDDGSGDW